MDRKFVVVTGDGNIIGPFEWDVLMAWLQIQYEELGNDEEMYITIQEIQKP